MSPSRPCLRCGALVSGASYCVRCQPKKTPTPGRGGGWTASRFRFVVLERAGHRCQMHVNGSRCTETTKLEAHHLVPLRHGGTNDVSNGVCVCRVHHEALEALADEAFARRKRLALYPKTKETA